MGELTTTLHHVLLKRALVLVALNPLVETLAFLDLVFELTFVRTSIGIHSVTVTMTLI
jgi:hypothetical protein